MGMGSICANLFYVIMVLYFAATAFTIYNLTVVPSCTPGQRCFRPTLDVKYDAEEPSSREPAFDLYVYTSSPIAPKPALLWSRKVAPLGAHW